MNMKRFSLFAVVLVMGLICIINPVMAVSLTSYEDLSTNNTLHIKTELDLSENNFTVLFDNKPIDYTPTHDVIVTGLSPNTEYSLLLISPYGQIQQISVMTDEENKKQFYYEYGVIGLFILSIIMIIIGYYIPLLSILAVLFSILGFIQAVTTEQSYLTSMIFVIIFAVAGMMFGIRNRIL